MTIYTDIFEIFLKLFEFLFNCLSDHLNILIILLFISPQLFDGLFRVIFPWVGIFSRGEKDLTRISHDSLINN